MQGSILRLICTITAAAIISACGEAGPTSGAMVGAGSQATPVKTVIAEETTISYRLQALGTLSARNATVVTANVSEKLTALYFEDGQHVDKGTLLATLEQAEEKALLASARADLTEQDRELKRLEKLLKTQVAARTEYDQRLSERDRALAAIAEAEAKIEERNLRAPFAGYVGLRAVSTGALLTPGTAITTLDDLDTMQLDFQLPSLALASLRLGQRVDALSDALQQSFSGEVSAIDHRIDPVSRSITARALIDNREGRLKPGMLMRVGIVAPERRGIEIPEEALLSDQQEHYVWLVSPEQQAQRRTIEVGTRRPGAVEVRSGISRGEQIIVEGFMSLRPGASVAVQEG